ncbi:MAG: hypothetical protein ACI4UE_05295 [Candidatus Scatovivens sp.]
MLKKSMKIVGILAIIAIITISLMPNVFAKLSTGLDYDKAQLQATTGGSVYNATSTVVNTALGVIQLVGMGIAVIMLVVLAIKYISAAPGDKAEIKKHAVVYIVGAIVLFAAAGILQIIKNFADSSLNNVS